MLKIIAKSAAAIPSSSRLNPVQMHLLHLFSRPMSELELKEQMLLVEWYDRKAQEKWTNSGKKKG
ncbi:MAG: hypothetical protein IPM82_11785 [Saprospiraceae bacterium]|nr:hypothetical protein [Saprospiraceae bacterium]